MFKWLFHILIFATVVANIKIKKKPLKRQRNLELLGNVNQMSQTNFPFTPYTWRLHLFGQAVLQKIFGNVDGRRSLLTVSILHHMRLCRSLQNNDGTRFLAVSILINFPLTGNRSRKHITFTFLCRGKSHYPKKVSDSSIISET